MKTDHEFRLLKEQLRADQIDALMDTYCEWREECTSVHEAYAAFCDVGSAERALAYAAYSAALDREGAACQRYAEQIECVLSGRALHERWRRRAENRDEASRGEQPDVR
jgi:hypothetical protein